MSEEFERLTPNSLPIPKTRQNNFWYDRQQTDTTYVFVHGIVSDSRLCWMHDDTDPAARVFWPDLIRKDDRFRHPSIYMGGYHTAWDAGDFPVEQCAYQLRDALERHDGGPPVLASSRIAFVCHSTGGIVVRSMLERFERLFKDKAVGLALIASPSQGSWWANLATPLFRFLNQQLALQLRVKDRTLLDVHTRFKDLHDERNERMPGLVGMEAAENLMLFRDKVPRPIRVALPPLFKIVTTHSAGQYFGAPRVLPGTDHSTAVKPTGLDSEPHLFLVTFHAKFEKADSGVRAPTVRPMPPLVEPTFNADEQATRALILDYTQRFVGRRSELAQIGALLDRRTPGYVHVRAEGGSGKSAFTAMVVQKVGQRVREGDTTVLLYAFISAGRTDTRQLLQTLNAQLAGALGSHDPAKIELADLRAQFNRLWDQLMIGTGEHRGVLLCVDGLDELDELDGLREWLPADLAPYVHVLVTSRPHVNLAHLLPRTGHIGTRATVLELPRLGSDDIAELLTLLRRDFKNAPATAARIRDLTGGQALAAFLLSREVVNGGPDALDRQHLSAALTEYLDEDAERLTAAAGGLQRQVIAALAVAAGALAAADMASALRVGQSDIESALEIVRRHLARGPHLEFVHPELKAAVARHLSEGEKAAAAQSLSAWMRSFAGSHPPESIPEYILNHLVDHLTTDNADRELFAAVFSPTWREARRRQTHSYRLYVNDLTKVRDHAATRERWPEFCRACYLLAQLSTVAAGIPTSLIVLKARLGDVAAAEGYALLDPDPASKTETLARLARFHTEGANVSRAREMLVEAEKALYGVTDLERRCALLAVLVARFAGIGDDKTADALAGHCLSTTRLIADPWKRERSVAVAVDALAAANDFKAATDVALSGDNEFGQRERLVALAVRLAEQGHLDVLHEALLRLANTVWYDGTVGAVLKTLASNGQDAAVLFLAATLKEPDEARVHLCAGLALSGRLDQSLNTLEKIGGGLPIDHQVTDREDSVVGRIRRRLSGEPRAVPRASGSSWGSSWRRQRAVEQLLTSLPDDLSESDISMVARRVEAALRREIDTHAVERLATLAAWLAQRGAIGAAGSLARRLKADAESIGAAMQVESRLHACSACESVKAWSDAIELAIPVLAVESGATSEQRHEAGLKLTEALGQMGRFDEALSTARNIGSASWRAVALGTIAWLLLKGGDTARSEETTKDAINLASAITDEKEQLSALRVIAIRFARAGSSAEAFEAARSVRDDRERNAVFDTLARELAGHGMIDAAREAVRANGDYSKRQPRLSRIAQRLLDSRDYEQALSVSTQIESSLERSLVLGALARATLLTSTPYDREPWIDRLLREADALDSFARLVALGQIAETLMSFDVDRARTIVDSALQTVHGDRTISPKDYIALAAAFIDAGAGDKALRLIHDHNLAASDAGPQAARLLFRLKQWDEAMAIVGRVKGLTLIHLLADLAEAAVAQDEPARAAAVVEVLDEETRHLASDRAPMAKARLSRLRYLTDDLPRARELAEEAFRDMATVKGGQELWTLAGPLARAGQLDLAQKCLHSAKQRLEHYIEATTAEELAEAGEKVAAIQLALRCLAAQATEPADGTWRGLVNARCIAALAKGGSPDVALQHVSVVEEIDHKVTALTEIAQAFLAAGDPSRAYHVARQALNALASNQRGTRPGQRAKLSALLFRLDHADEARAEVERALREGQSEGLDGFLDAVVQGAPAFAAKGNADLVAAVLSAVAAAAARPRSDGP